eukprot:1146549-Pelagomonas_calceolata.AAC.1
MEESVHTQVYGHQTLTSFCLMAHSTGFDRLGIFCHDFPSRSCGWARTRELLGKALKSRLLKAYFLQQAGNKPVLITFISMHYRPWQNHNPLCTLYLQCFSGRGATVGEAGGGDSKPAGTWLTPRQTLASYLLFS